MEIAIDIMLSKADRLLFAELVTHLGTIATRSGQIHEQLAGINQKVGKLTDSTDRLGMLLEALQIGGK